MDLARELGYTVAELDSRLGEDELDWWHAYFQVRVFGERAAWVRFAARQMAKCDPRKPAEMRDFMPPEFEDDRPIDLTSV